MTALADPRINYESKWATLIRIEVGDADL